MKKPCILVIDDERRYRDLVELNLTRRGYRVVTASSGLGGLNSLERDGPDLVVLDLLLPDIDGYEVCRRIREFSTVPIIMLTARAEESQKVQGLRLGADDYVTKPFGADELLARIEAVLRRIDRREPLPVLSVFRTGDLVVDFARRQVWLDGTLIDLTAGEYKLLHTLALHPGQVLVQEELLRRVWGPEYEDDADLLYSAIRRLRRKLGDDPNNPRYIQTRRGIGYTLANATRTDEPEHDEEDGQTEEPDDTESEDNGGPDQATEPE
ncbi:MAG: response regulator transcription factor [Chloroflexi bacterium]|nr:response regulator transcription factor [Chloroflexota bacterium]